MIRGSRSARWALGCALALVTTAAAAAGAGDPPPVLREVTKLVPDGDALEIELGYSVAIQDGTVFGGAPMGHYLDDDSEGSTFVFRRDSIGEEWSQVARLRVLDGEKDHFGYALGVSGETLVVSSRYPPSAAWIFERDALGDWVEVAHFDPQDVGGFGWSSAVSGETVVVGSPHDSGYVGLVFVYERVAGEWQEVQRLYASDAEQDTYFGWSLAIGGDTLLVGAPEDDDGGDPANYGAVYVFERDGPGTPWGEVAKLRASDPSRGADFGRSSALSGKLAVVGAPGAEVAGEPVGAAYLLERDPEGGWTEVSKLVDPEPDGDSFDDFGYTVAIDDGLIVVGEPGDDAQRLSAGAAHLFERDGADPGGARHVAKLLPTDGGYSDYFGWSVGISGETVIGGARWEDEVERNAGAIYVFDAEPCRLELRVEPEEVRPGDELAVEIALSHNRLRSATVPFLLWIEDPDGDFVTGTSTRPITFHHADTVRRQLALRIPEGAPPGVYSVLVGIERMEQGVAGARGEVRVVPAQGASAWR